MITKIFVGMVLILIIIVIVDYAEYQNRIK
jgi:hypothetical protein